MQPNDVERSASTRKIIDNHQQYLDITAECIEGTTFAKIRSQVKIGNFAFKNSRIIIKQIV